MSNFRNHGTYSISINNDTLIIDAKGPFNLETINSYHAELLDSITTMASQNRPWGQIIILHEESLFTPEAATKLMESNQWRKTQGLARCAVVLVHPVGASLIRKQLHRIYGDAGIEMSIFTDQADAQTWLTELAGD